MERDVTGFKTIYESLNETGVSRVVWQRKSNECRITRSKKYEELPYGRKDHSVFLCNAFNDYLRQGYSIDSISYGYEKRQDEGGMVVRVKQLTVPTFLYGEGQAMIKLDSGDYIDADMPEEMVKMIESFIQKTVANV